jgi:hypothetical protein
VYEQLSNVVANEPGLDLDVIALPDRVVLNIDSNVRSVRQLLDHNGDPEFTEPAREPTSY